MPRLLQGGALKQNRRDRCLTLDGIQALRSVDCDRLAGAHPDAHDRLSRRGQDRVHQEPRGGICARGHQMQGRCPRRLDSGAAGFRRLSGLDARRRPAAADGVGARCAAPGRGGLHGGGLSGRAHHRSAHDAGGDVASADRERVRRAHAARTTSRGRAASSICAPATRSNGPPAGRRFRRRWRTACGTASSRWTTKRGAT